MRCSATSGADLAARSPQTGHPGAAPSSPAAAPPAVSSPAAGGSSIAPARKAAPARAAPVVTVAAWSLTEACPPARHASWLAMLDENERRRLASLRRPQDASRFLAAHAGMRQRLGQWLGVAPASLVFIAGPAGKPALARGSASGSRQKFARDDACNVDSGSASGFACDSNGGFAGESDSASACDSACDFACKSACEPTRDCVRISACEAAVGAAIGPQPDPGRHGNCHFNLGHSGDFAMLAIAGCAVGIDIEAMPAATDVTPGLLEQTLQPAEIAAFDGLPHGDRAALFLRYWVAKEAVMKAAGLGLSLDPRAIGVDFGRGIARVETGALTRMSAVWRFAAGAGAGSTRIDASGSTPIAALWQCLALDAPAGYRAALAIAGDHAPVVRYR